MKFCNRCMTPLEGPTCPHCGYDPANGQNIPHALLPGTVLKGKYLLGNVLGQGGFGITYIGFDLALEVKVAIKEYFVSGNASRQGAKGPQVYWMSDPGNMDHFITEARRMALLEQMPEIAHVRDVFYENGTAYIIMEYVEGRDLKSYLQEHGPMPYDQAVQLLLPVIEALGRVHEKNLVHRDISPDNLMMEPQGTLRVLDLGAAGDLTRNEGQASQMVARHGFSPYEQYIPTGKIGPWTDVYAVCATLYYCCTGKRIPDAYARVDLLMKTKSDRIPMDAAIPQAGQQVLQQGLAVEAANRIPDMPALAEALRGSLAGKAPKKRKGKAGILVAGILLLAVAVGGMLLPGKPEPPAQQPEQVRTEPQTEATRSIALELEATLDLPEVSPGQTADIRILSGPAPEAITWSSGDPQVAQVSPEGRVTAVGFGTTDITGTYEGQTSVCRVTVTLGGNVNCTYVENDTGLTITGFTGDVNPNAILPSTIDGRPVTRIGKSAFRDCGSLVSLVIPQGVTRIEQYAFSDCTALREVTFPERLQRIESDAFYGCAGLTEAVLPDSLFQLGENAFSYCTALTSVVLPRNLAVLESSVFCGCKNLAELVIPDSVTQIREGVFRYCTALTDISIPNGVTEIGSSAFRDCTALKQVTMAEGLGTIGEAAFSGCTALEQITLSAGLHTIRTKAFAGCTALQDVTFPDKKLYIDTEAFFECTALKQVTISNDCELLYGAFPSLCTIKFY